jgi:hypothetical protein
MAEMVLEHDWASTPLGPISDWPFALRSAVSTCLSSNFPLLVMWGPELTKIYNDGYRMMLGSEKHPKALGAPVASIWPEIWDTIGPMFDSVVSTGQATWEEDFELHVDRNGFLEECYWTFSYSPLFDDDGSINGVIDISVETTDEVVARRRLRCIAALNAALTTANRPTDVCVAAVNVLSQHTRDVVAADILLETEGRLLPIVTNRRTSLPLSAERDAEQVFADGEMRVIGQDSDGGPADRCLVPFNRGEGLRGGVLVASLSPIRPFDGEYSRFLEVLGRTLGGAVDSAEQRAAALGQIQVVNETLQRAMLSSITETDTFAARYLPAANHLFVGGDWYDIIELGTGRRAMVVGDCVGHDLDAATAMAQLRSASQALLMEGNGPAATVTALDAFSASVEGAELASVAVAVIDRGDRTITYSRAGHPPPLLVQEGQATWLDEPAGPVLGLPASDGRRVVERHQHVKGFTPGDLLILYSDGLVERRDRPLEDQTDRLRKVVEDGPGRHVGVIADDIVSELVEGAPAPDNVRV